MTVQFLADCSEGRPPPRGGGGGGVGLFVLLMYVQSVPRHAALITAVLCCAVSDHDPVWLHRYSLG
jgi:hypothetical protein